MANVALLKIFINYLVGSDIIKQNKCYCGEEAVYGIFNDEGLMCWKHRWINMKIVIDVYRVCSDCKKKLHIDEFANDSERKYGKHSICKKCKNKRRYKNRNTFNGYLSKLLSHAKQHSKNMGKKGRTCAAEFNITLEYLKELYKSQKGRCYYSNMKMSLKTCSNWQLSLERLDNNKGYVIGNVVFICLELNTSVQWSKDKINDIKKLINQPFEHLDKEIFTSKPSRISTNKKQLTKEIDGIKYIKCNQCDEYKTEDMFNKQIRDGCKICQSIRKKLYNNTPRGRLFRLLNHAKSNTKKRNEVKSRNTDNTMDITFEFLVDLYIKQKGRCAYSNIPLRFDSSIDESWIISLERINPCGGYTEDNVCLICKELNSADNTSRRKYTNEDCDGCEGSGAWSAEKFQFLLSHLQE